MRRGAAASSFFGVGVGVCAGVFCGAAALAQERADLATAVRYDSRLAAAPASAARARAGDAKAQPLEIRVTGRMAFSPATVRSLVRVAQHADNRALRVAIESADYFRSSEMELDGEHAAQSHFFVWSALPPGAYSIVVSVLGPGGDVRFTRQAPFDVIGPRDR